MSSSTRARICSIFSKSAISIVVARLSAVISPLALCCKRMSSFPMMSVHPSITRSSASKPPDVSALKLSMRRFCQPGSRLAAHSGSVGRFAAHVDRRRSALEHVEVIGGVAEVRDALHRGRARADDADALALQAGEIPVAVAAGVPVVPTAGVERVALELGDAGDARQLRPVQRTARHAHVVGANAIAAVGAHDPASGGFVPTQLGDLGLEERVVVQVVVLADRPAVRQDLGGVGVLLLGDVPDLFEQGQIDVGLDVAHRARVAVPVPGAAEVATLLDHADVVDAGFTQTSAGQQPAEPSADDHDFDLVGQRLTHDRLDVRVFEVVRELARDLYVLVVRVGTQALVTL